MRPEQVSASPAVCFGCRASGRSVCKIMRSAVSADPAVPRMRSFKRDWIFQDQHDAPRLTGIIRRGYIRAERILHDGRRSILGLLVPGDLVGNWPGSARSCTLAAATDVQVCAYDPQLVRRVAARDAGLRLELLRIAADQNACQLDMVWRRGAMNSRERIIGFMVMATQIMPVHAAPEGGIVLDIDISRRDWADLTNTSVETICRLLGDLSETGMVRAIGGGRYHIRDLEALADLAGIDQRMDRLPIYPEPAPVRAPKVPVCATGGAIHPRNGTASLATPVDRMLPVAPQVSARRRAPVGAHPGDGPPSGRPVPN